MIKISIVFFAFIVTIISSNSFAQPPMPPIQPLDGPGGTEYVHGAVTRNGPYYAKGHNKDNNYKYYIFEPAEPMPVEAPVVLFLHAWLAYDPYEYRFWIEHMVRKGYVVVWAQYDGWLTFPWKYAEHARITWKDALNRLDGDEFHVRPERNLEEEMMTAIVGHSAGGYLSAILASDFAWWWIKIPKPYAVVSVLPGGKGFIPASNFKKIDPSTKLVLIVGDEDDVACKSTAMRIWNYIPQIPDENKDFLIVQSDGRGQPEQIANHYFPNNSGFFDTATVDARDFYVTFKLSVAALNCAFRGVDCEYALGNGSFEQVYMGEWSDGQPMNALIWVEDPNLLQLTCED